VGAYIVVVADDVAAGVVAAALMLLMMLLLMMLQLMLLRVKCCCCSCHDADGLEGVLIAFDGAEPSRDPAEHAHERHGPLLVVLVVPQTGQALVLRQSSLPTTFLTKPLLPQTQRS